MPAEPVSRPFLTAEWRYLAMLNYAVDPALLAPWTPRGTEVDAFGGKTYVSLVGFRFERARVRGLWIPFHSDFDEVNLRFYVKREHGGTVRRGVAFVREIVPRWAVATTARVVFHEKYVSLPMRHQVVEPTSEGGRVQVRYEWRHTGRWNSMRLECAGRPAKPAEGSLEQFITEHYWGYAAKADGGCVEYRVEHDPWRVWPAAASSFTGDAVGLYGTQLAHCLDRQPDSAFLAEGSSVAVFAGQRVG